MIFLRVSVFVIFSLSVGACLLSCHPVYEHVSLLSPFFLPLRPHRFFFFLCFASGQPAKSNEGVREKEKRKKKNKKKEEEKKKKRKNMLHTVHVDQFRALNDTQLRALHKSQCTACEELACCASSTSASRLNHKNVTAHVNCMHMYVWRSVFVFFQSRPQNDARV